MHKREEDLRREQARLEKCSERVISAYPEALVTLPQLRQRMPALHRQIHAVEAELHSLEIDAVDDARYPQLAETLATFRGKLRARAETLDVGQRQQILRHLVKEIPVRLDGDIIPEANPGARNAAARSWPGTSRFRCGNCFPNYPASLYNLAALSCSTMCASSSARSRVISPSFIISVSAKPSACRVLCVAIQPDSSHPFSSEYG